MHTLLVRSIVKYLSRIERTILPVRDETFEETVIIFLTKSFFTAIYSITQWLCRYRWRRQKTESLVNTFNSMTHCLCITRYSMSCRQILGDTLNHRILFRSSLFPTVLSRKFSEARTNQLRARLLANFMSRGKFAARSTVWNLTISRRISRHRSFSCIQEA